MDLWIRVAAEIHEAIQAKYEEVMANPSWRGALDTSALGICTLAGIFEATLGDHKLSSESGARQGRSSAVRESNFPDVERTIQDLTVSRSEKARVELEAFGNTTVPGVNRLLTSLSLYDYRQTMSRESRLAMRRRIKLLIVRTGSPRSGSLLTRTISRT